MNCLRIPCVWTLMVPMELPVRLEMDEVLKSLSLILHETKIEID